MYSQGKTPPTIRSRRASFLSAAGLLLVACSGADEVEIDLVRQAPEEARFAKPDATSSERFGGGPVSEHDHSEPTESPFVWQMPEDWVELPPQQFRDVNLRPGGHPELECYLTILQGSGGGLTANVNRWRGQLGLDAISDEEAAGLARTTLFGRPAVRVDLASEDGTRALLGVIYLSTSNMATVKLTGPPDLVEGQREGFELFRSTLDIREDSGATSSTGSATGAGAAGPGNTTGSSSGSGLAFDLPEGWSDAGARSMRLINLKTPGTSQCYVIQLVGEAGGLLSNLNRWRGEVGLEPFDQAAIDLLPKVVFLGQECPLLEVSGVYQGMGDQAGEDMTVFGVALIRSDASLFVKMVGPRADMAAERQHFLDFLASLREA